MEWVKTEIQVDGKKLSYETESNGLYHINCLSNVINVQDKIIEILVTKDMIIILTEDRDLRNGARQAPIYKDDRQINNIDAYSWNGQHLWNIGEIVGDIKTPFTGSALILNDELVDKGVLNVENEYSFDLLVCCAGAYQFTIDPVNKKIISKISGKW